MRRDGLKILVVGGGGREHALAWKLASSPRVARVYCAPGNPGTAEIACNVPLAALDFEALVAFAQGEGIDLVVVGPSLPLIRGIGEPFRAAGIPFFGPGPRQAIIEGSKVFSKAFMARHGIPTPESAWFEYAEPAESYVRSHWRPEGLVLKTEGLAVKADGVSVLESVVVCASLEQALFEVDRALRTRYYGPAGARILVEERLFGPEASFIAFIDGKTWKAMPSVQDHKPLYEGNHGPNTEGMGAFVPTPTITPPLLAEIETRIMAPTLRGLAAEGLGYPGVLYAGLIQTEDGPKVLEYNCRFGDPEAQVLLCGLQTDLVDVIEACLEGTLDRTEVAFCDEAFLCVVGAAPGYPGDVRVGEPVTGLEAAAATPDVRLFHALIAWTPEGLVTAGGRVVNAVARGRTLEEARRRAYAAMEPVRFGACPPVMRRDLGTIDLTPRR